MPTSETNVELVRFSADGLDTIQAATEHFAKTVAETQARSRVFAKTVGDGSYGRYADQIAAAARSQERLAAAARNSFLARAAAAPDVAQHARVMAMHERVREQLRTRELRQRLGDPAHAREAALTEREQAEQENVRADFRNRVFAARADSGDLERQSLAARKLNHELEVMQGRARNQVLSRELTDGTFARRARDVAALRKETEDLAKKSRLTGLVAEHGRWGAVLRENAKEVGTLKTAAVVGYGVITASVMSLVRAGLAGTVEGYRLEYAWTRLGRQAASIAVPAVDKVSGAVGRLASRFEKLSGNEQDALLTLGLFAVLSGPVVAAARAMGAIGGAALGLGRGIGSVLGMRAAPAAAAGGFGSYTAAVTGGAAAAGTTAAAGGAGLMRFALPAAGALATAGALAPEDVKPGRYRGMSNQQLAQEFDRERMDSTWLGRRLGNNLGSLGAGAFDAINWTQKQFTGQSFKRDDFRSNVTQIEEEMDRRKKRNDVTPLQVGSDELGAGHQRIQEEVLKVSFAKAEEAKAMKELTDSVKGLNKTLELLTGQKWSDIIASPTRPRR